jgi:shikimate kinase
MSHIFLYGPPGTGKSTIGDSLARSLLLPFVDVDQLIESQAGMSIARIMGSQGQSAFRELESAALQEIAGHSSSVTSSDDKVIALGGGVLLYDENRRLAEDRGTVVSLLAEPETLLERLKNKPGKRPILAGDLQEKLTSLLLQRREHYASFALQLPVDGKTAEEVAFQIQTRLGRFHLNAMGEYDVLVQPAGQVGNLLHERPCVAPGCLRSSSLFLRGRTIKTWKRSRNCGTNFWRRDLTVKARSLPWAAV